MPTPVNRFDLDSQRALLARVRAGYTVRAASKELGFAEITVFKLRKRDSVFRAALIEAQAVGKEAGKARKVERTRQAMRALSAASPPPAPVSPPEPRPSASLRAMVEAMSAPAQRATAGEPIAVGRIVDGQLLIDATQFAMLLDAARRAAQRGALPGA